MEGSELTLEMLLRELKEGQKAIIHEFTKNLIPINENAGKIDERLKRLEHTPEDQEKFKGSNKEFSDEIKEMQNSYIKTLNQDFTIDFTHSLDAEVDQINEIHDNVPEENGKVFPCEPKIVSNNYSDIIRVVEKTSVLGTKDLAIPVNTLSYSDIVSDRPDPPTEHVPVSDKRNLDLATVVDYVENVGMDELCVQACTCDKLDHIMNPVNFSEYVSMAKKVVCLPVSREVRLMNDGLSVCEDEWVYSVHVSEDNGVTFSPASKLMNDALSLSQYEFVHRIIMNIFHTIVTSRLGCRKKKFFGWGASLSRKQARYSYRKKKRKNRFFKLNYKSHTEKVVYFISLRDLNKDQTKFHKYSGTRHKKKFTSQEAIMKLLPF